MIAKTVYSMRSLFISMIFLFSGNAVLVSSAAIMLTKLGANDREIGFVATSYFLGGLISTITSHRIVSNVGHIRSFAIFSSLLALFGLAHVVFMNIYAWIFFRFVLGYSYYSLLMIIESWLNERCDNAIRSRVLSVYEGVFYTSFGLGVLFLSLNLDDIKMLCMAIGLLMFCVIPISLFRVQEPNLPQKMKINIPNVFSVSILATITAFIGGMLINSFNFLSSVYVMRLGYSQSDFSYFLALSLFGGFIGQSFMGFFSDKFGRKIAICVVSAVGFCVCFAMIFVKSFSILLILAFCFGMSVFCLYVLALARANDQASREEIVSVARSVLFSYSLGSVIAPMILGELMSAYGEKFFMGFYSVCLFILFIVALFRPIIPINKRQKFMHLPKTIVNIKSIIFEYNKKKHK